MASPVLQVRVPDGTLERIDAAKSDEQSRSDWARAVLLAALDGELMTPDQAVAYVYEMRTGGPPAPEPLICMSDGSQLPASEFAARQREALARIDAPEAESSPPVADGFPAPRMPRHRGGE